MSLPHPALREVLSFRPWFPEVDLAALSALWKRQAWPELCSGSRSALDGVLRRVAGSTGVRADAAPASIQELEAAIRARGIPLPERLEKAMAWIESSPGKTQADAAASLDALLLVMRWAKANLPDPGWWAKTTPIARGVVLGLFVVFLAGGAVASMSPAQQEEKKAVVVERQPPLQKEPAPAVVPADDPRPVEARKPKAPAPAEVAAAADPQPNRKMKKPQLGSDLSALDPWDRGIVEEARQLRLDGMEKEAIERMTEVLHRNPHDPTVLYELAITFRMVGNLDETRALLVRSCKAGDQRACKLVQGPPAARIR